MCGRILSEVKEEDLPSMEQIAKEMEAAIGEVLNRHFPQPSLEVVEGGRTLKVVSLPTETRPEREGKKEGKQDAAAGSLPKPRKMGRRRRGRN